MQTVQTLLQMSGLPRLEGRMLLEFVLKKPRSWLLAHDTDPLAPEVTAAFLSLTAKRRQGHPMAYLLGQREFRGHMLQVSPDVLIPRPDTELLVEIGLDALEAVKASSLLDLGTGSGAIAISIALARPDLRVTATDFSAAALAVAQANAQRLGANVQWCEGDWYEALPSEGRFDVIVSNPPYIAGNDRHLLQGDLRFEPRQALTDEEDGLSDIKTIIDGAALRLNAGGQLWLEHGYDQGREVQDLLGLAGFSSVNTHHDLAGQPRVTGGSL